MKKDSPIIFIIIVVALIGLGVAGVIFLQNLVPDTIKSGSSMDNTAKSVVRCEEVIKASLRSPAKAKFSNQKTSFLGTNRYQVTGNVDAPNASGIVVRGNYNCNRNCDTKSFDLVSL
jgi:hypothetical protein